MPGAGTSVQSLAAGGGRNFVTQEAPHPRPLDSQPTVAEGQVGEFLILAPQDFPGKLSASPVGPSPIVCEPASRRPMAKRRKQNNAAPTLRPVLLQPDQPDGPSAKEEKPIIAERHWPALPLWIALHAERGPIRKCWSGCRLFHVRQDGRRYKRCEIRGCGVQPAAGSEVMACPKCRWVGSRPNPSPKPSPNPSPSPSPNPGPIPTPSPKPHLNPKPDPSPSLTLGGWCARSAARGSACPHSRPTLSSTGQPAPACSCPRAPASRRAPRAPSSSARAATMSSSRLSRGSRWRPPRARWLGV